MLPLNLEKYDFNDKIMYNFHNDDLTQYTLAWLYVYTL